MRYGADHKQETRARIVGSASRALRAKGLQRLAVADVMASAGLTHGGFYAHFASKDALVAEAVDAMFAEGRRRLPSLDDPVASTTVDERAAFRAHLAAYLSPQHRDRPDRGCPLPALSADVARDSGATRDRFVLGFGRMVARHSAALRRMGASDPDAEARFVVAQIVGAIALARAIGKGDASDAILDGSFQGLCARLGL